MKRLGVVLFLTVVTFLSGYFILINLNKPVIYKSVSERAIEYMHEQKKNNNETWVNSNIATNESKLSISSSKDITNECFSISIPFKILNVKESDVCNRYVTFTSPRGEVTVYEVDTETAALDENPSIIMRRSNKTVYNESNIAVNGRRYIIFTESKEGNGMVAFTQENAKLFVLSIKVYTDEDMSEKFSQMLGSIIFN